MLIQFTISNLTVNIFLVYVKGEGYIISIYALMVCILLYLEYILAELLIRLEVTNN